MSNFNSNIDKVEKHYTNPNLGTAILEALAKAGKDLDNLRPEDLAPIDEFHIRGPKATRDLAEMLDLDETKHVLDLGSGIGGPSRFLAQKFGCRVTGLDLTEEYCRTAQMLSDRFGLGEAVQYQHGDALDMPFADVSFDLVWMQHTAMNIPDKPRLITEIRRVLKPGGTLALYEVFAGQGGGVYFPVPWARDPSISSLCTPDEIRQLLEEIGFEIINWQDCTEICRNWFSKRVQKMQGKAPPPLGIHLLMGSDFPAMARNQVRNLEENRIAVVEMIARRVAVMS